MPILRRKDTIQRTRKTNHRHCALKMSSLKASILYPLDKRIIKLFEAESKSFLRASYTLDSDEENIIFNVSASDSTALRAALTTITKVLSVWEATKEEKE